MHPHRRFLFDDTCDDSCFLVRNTSLPLSPRSPLLNPNPNPNPNPSPSTSRSHRLSNSLLLAAALLSAAVLLSLTFFAVLRRRRRRLLPPFSPAAGAAGALGPAGNNADGDDDDAEPLHHAWYIRTVGLDEATIASLPVATHRGGGGGGGDCSVCLGEFRDGELVRLLPKCAHTFHLSCIDTWLRAHVSCPLCRSLVVDPSVTVTVADPPASASASASIPTPIAADELGPTQSNSADEEISREEEEEEEVENRATVVASDLPPQGSAAAPSPNDPVIERSVSMDLPHVFVSVTPPPEPDENVLNSQEDQIVTKEKEKDLQPNLSKALASSAHLEIERSLSSSGRGFFFSRHGRARSSILPL